MLDRRKFIFGASTLFLTTKGTLAGIPTEPWAKKLVAAARAQVGVTLFYDPNYTKLTYPNGDVPLDRGVCTDVIVRAYRQSFGVDLQKLVHEDMQNNFTVYPKKWGLKAPDANIDHRRVPNLQVFFARRKASLPISTTGADYWPGDIISMNLPGNLTHIALVSDQMNDQGSNLLCIHNIGQGAKIEDLLFAFPLTGHYRFKP
jgi:uncharacterized protein